MLASIVRNGPAAVAAHLDALAFGHRDRRLRRSEVEISNFVDSVMSRCLGHDCPPLSDFVALHLETALHRVILAMNVADDDDDDDDAGGEKTEKEDKGEATASRQRGIVSAFVDLFNIRREMVFRAEVLRPWIEKQTFASAHVVESSSHWLELASHAPLYLIRGVVCDGTSSSPSLPSSANTLPVNVIRRWVRDFDDEKRESTGDNDEDEKEQQEEDESGFAGTSFTTIFDKRNSESFVVSREAADRYVLQLASEFATLRRRIVVKESRRRRAREEETE